LVSPSLLGFLSPGNGGSEEGIKTIEDGRGCYTKRLAKKVMQPESKKLWYSALFITFKRYLHISITNEKHQILKF
jgi:hypothetical protein